MDSYAALRDLPQVDLAPLIDHSLLVPTATPEQVVKWCDECDRYQFAAVCVAPTHVLLAREQLQGTAIAICTVIGFPTGATTSGCKLYEAQEAAEHGATELDVVINLGWLKSGQHDRVHREIAEICEATNVPVKAILETSVLTPGELKTAADLCMDAGARFLKTSTGWQGGATVEAVRQLHELSRGRVGIKASGGIRTAEQALRLMQAGANRIGTSWGPDLIQQQEALAER
ncbi:deoxyribose-phosphate aldolase [Halomicronema sp. CCY15110]|uniref:deoxyribose-phosphate aldolase n=1 Tax=Halomicronema sp. CCY15110 TaxID=2767773 RepID=UPI0019509F35|nr:deoxyribose-phosphate aldolase [Halomicronema sp. CCY15110]